MKQSALQRESIVAAEKWLAAHDRKLAGLIERFGPCTIYEGNALIDKTAFHCLAWSIINQQLSVASARSIEIKLLRHHPGATLQRAIIAALSDTDLRACGLSRQKIRYLRALVRAFSDGTLSTHRLKRHSNEQLDHHLGQLPGIGPWSIDMFLMFYLARLDVLPLGDLALRKAISITYNIDDVNDRTRMALLGEKWAPYRTIASWYLWCVVD